MQAAVIDGRVAAFYGAPLATGATAEEAEQAFWAAHTDAFGVSNLDLMVTRSHDIGFGKFTVYAYQQRTGGLPIEYATGRLLVVNGDSDSVTFASGRFAPTVDEPGDPMIAPEIAIALVAGSPSFSYMGNWSAPELVIYAGTPDQFGPVKFGSPVLAWKFSGDFEGENSPFQAATFFIDANSGELLGTRSDLSHFDVIGKVEGYATPIDRNGQPWAGPYDPNDPLTVRNLDVPGIRARLTTGEQAFTSAAGTYVIGYSGGFPVTVSTDVISGQWAVVDNAAGAEISDSVVVPNSATPGHFSLGDPNSASEVAQLNAFIYANLARTFFVSRTAWTGLNYPISLGINGGLVCDAFAHRGDIQFGIEEILPDPNTPCAFGLNNCCPNMASPPVVCHEYGHFVQAQLGFVSAPPSGDAFGEGFSDAVALLVIDDPFIGRGLPPQIARDYSPTVSPGLYPCTAGESHECGKVLAGFWRDIRTNLAALNPTVCGFNATGDDALAFTRQLFVDWAQMTQGGLGVDQSAHPLTLRELYTLIDGYSCADAADVKTAVCSAAIRHALATAQLPGGGCKTPAGTPAPGVMAFRTPIMWNASQIHPGGQPDGFDPISIAIADLDLDNLNDVILLCKARPGSSDGCVIVAWGASSTPKSYSFASAATVVSLLGGGVPARTATADLGGSVAGRDIVISLPNLNGLQVLYYNGNRSFSPSGLVAAQTDEQPPQTVLEPQHVRAGDWDGDGLGDVAVAGYRPIGGSDRPVLAPLWGNGGGTFDKRAYWPATFGSDATGRGYALAEWNDASGQPAFALTNSNMNAPLINQRIYVFRRGSGVARAFASRLAYPAISSTMLASLRVDSDALVDFASTFFSPVDINPAWWFGQDAAGDFARFGTESFATYPGVTAIAAGPLTKNATLPLSLDSRDEIVVVGVPLAPDGTQELFVKILLNTGLSGSGRFLSVSLPVSVNPFDRPFPVDAVVVDINTDGFPDVALANRGRANNPSNPPVDLFEGFSIVLNRGVP